MKLAAEVIALPFEVIITYEQEIKKRRAWKSNTN
jgi:hypothetical protein